VLRSPIADAKRKKRCEKGQVTEEASTMKVGWGQAVKKRSFEKQHNEGEKDAR